MALGPERMKPSSRRHWVAELGQGPEPFLPCRKEEQVPSLSPELGDANLEDSQRVYGSASSLLLWSPRQRPEDWTQPASLREATVVSGSETVAWSLMELP